MWLSSLKSKEGNMKLPLIYWTATINGQQANSTEKYPYFGLLLGIDGDTAIVLYYTYKKAKVLTTISQKQSKFFEIGEMEVPDTLREDVRQYIRLGRVLNELSDDFLNHVDKCRRIFDEVDDSLQDAMSPQERFLAKMTARSLEQPFPRYHEEF